MRCCRLIWCKDVWFYRVTSTILVLAFENTVVLSRTGVAFKRITILSRSDHPKLMEILRSSKHILGQTKYSVAITTIIIIVIINNVLHMK